MPPIHKKYEILSLLAILVFISIILWIWQAWTLEKAKINIEEVYRSEDINSLLAGEKTIQEEIAGAVDLAFKDISIIQGEKGILSWKMTADWATIRQELTLIEIASPNILYYMGSESDRAHLLQEMEQENDIESVTEDTILSVIADTGIVFDNTTKIKLNGNIIAEYQLYTLNAPSLDYDNDDRILSFNDTAHLKSPEMYASSDIIHWNLNTNILSGHGNVSMVWETKKN